MAEFEGWKFNAYPHLKHYNITRPGDDDWIYASFDLCDFKGEIAKRFKYHTDRNALHAVWERFRDLAISDRHVDKHADWQQHIAYRLAFNPIEEAFEALSKAIKWYNTIK